MDERRIVGIIPSVDEQNLSNEKTNNPFSIKLYFIVSALFIVILLFTSLFIYFKKETSTKLNKSQTIINQKDKDLKVYTAEGDTPNEYREKLEKELEGYKSNFEKDKYLKMLNNL